mgnify:CR=1 FL=1
MPIDAGKLDRRITLQARTTTRGSAGGVEISYSDERTVWAEDVNTTGGKLRASGALRPETTHVFRIRYISTLTEQYRIRYKSRSFDVIQIDEEERNESQLIQARYVEGRE